MFFKGSSTKYSLSLSNSFPTFVTIFLSFRVTLPLAEITTDKTSICFLKLLIKISLLEAINLKILSVFYFSPSYIMCTGPLTNFVKIYASVVISLVKFLYEKVTTSLIESLITKTGLVI